MARITVEDCIDKFPSRFELVLVASNRARKLHSGEISNIEKDNDKNTVIALREIAEEALSVDELRNNLIEEYQTVTFSEDEELEDLNEKENLGNDKEANVIEDKLLNKDHASDEKVILSDEEALKENKDIIDDSSEMIENDDSENSNNTEEN